MKPSLTKQIVVSTGFAALTAAVLIIGFWPEPGPKYRIATDGQGHYVVQVRLGMSWYNRFTVHEFWTDAEIERMELEERARKEEEEKRRDWTPVKEPPPQMRNMNVSPLPTNIIIKDVITWENP